jgi:hypothetical protein
MPLDKYGLSDEDLRAIGAQSQDEYGDSGAGARARNQGAGYVDLGELAKTDPNVAMQYVGAGAQGNMVMPDFSGFTDADWQNIGQTTGIDPKPAPTNEGRFGNDMGWLDELFQTDPGAALAEAQAQGTSADPNIVKQQQSMVDEINGRGTSADPEAEAAQKKAIGELFGLYDQGGRGAQDQNARAQARATSENWLKGQRDADRQSLAQRGMLGSGADLLMQSSDSQGAAQRLSAADLQASADAEKRALDALMGGGQLAGQVRGQSDAYKQGNTALAGGMLGDMNTSANNYVQSNADRIAKTRAANTDFLKSSYTDMINRRNDWDKNVFNQQIGAAQNQQQLDANQNAQGWQSGFNTAGTDTGAANNAQSNFNTSTTGAFTGASPAVNNSGQTVVGLTGAPQAAAGEAFSGAAKAIASIYGGALSGGGSGKTEKK